MSKKKTTDVLSVEDLRQKLVECTRCGCLKDAAYTFAPINIVHAYQYERESYDDTDSCWIFQDETKRFRVFWEWSDSTGHGCQCGAAVTAPFATLAEAY